MAELPEPEDEPGTAGKNEDGEPEAEDGLIAALERLGLAPASDQVSAPGARGGRAGGRGRGGPGRTSGRGPVLTGCEHWYMVVRAPPGRSGILGAYWGEWQEVATTLGVADRLLGWGGYLQGFDTLGPALLFWHEHHPEVDCPFR